MSSLLSYHGMRYLEYLKSVVMLCLFYLYDLSPSLQNIPSSTLLNSSGLWLNTHWSNILLLDFCFHMVKPLMPILPLLPILCVYEKLVYENALITKLLRFSVFPANIGMNLYCRKVKVSTRTSKLFCMSARGLPPSA